ncbi:MAG: glycoside hydrolase family 18 protein [Sedimentisphaerales bacterium]|nr:glycoside hydrolase family 18 protein [Sedimentisphaerales bacterium]NLZ05767.1 glycoside hydrolase family 18 protein [Phycisphaerae bacterium]HNY78936.1 glycoside hydrolase family 18 protein [Sedimentisphaerales bacterium]HOC62648.1 glycoside hydrolase family 18 protein [Sedimentisphaerales bacterium]HOH64846.1 glycoside hydrolase family 18 protein [Sedimentisphaerales bacterium]
MRARSRTRILQVAVALAATLVMAAGCHSFSKPAKPKYNVVAYVAGYRDFDFSTIQADKITHVNYAFVNVVDGQVHFDTSIDNTPLKKDDIFKLHALKKINPDLKVLVSVGGWTWSGGFSDAALTDQSRRRFAASAAAFVDAYDLDGIDLDWEYPNSPGAGNVYRPQDVQNFTLLLQAVREELDRLSARKPDHRHYLLTIATGANQHYVDNTELGKLHRYLDFLNIMTYDFYHGGDHRTGHHSNFRPSSSPERDKNSIVHAVDLHIQAGVPPHKINLGIPFYGRKWTGVRSGENHGLFQEAESVGDIVFYRQIVPCLRDDACEQHWDEAAQAPYLWNPEEAVFISYENARSMTAKVQYLKAKGLGGVMFWEYSDDYQGELLGALDRALAGASDAP